MSIISFSSNLFNVNDINGVIESPDNIRTKMVRTVIDKCPHDVEVINGPYTTSILRDNKKVDISVWKFALIDVVNKGLFNSFIENGDDFVIAWSIQFYDNEKLLTDINSNANMICAMGYAVNDERRVLFMLGTKAMTFSRMFDYDIKMFFADTDPMIDAVANAIKGASIEKTKVGFCGDVPVKDYIVKLSFSNGKLTAVIPHKYTMSDDMYGARYVNYSKTIDFTTIDSVKSFDWDSLWNDLYDNRNGTCVYRGSLGS